MPREIIVYKQVYDPDHTKEKVIAFKGDKESCRNFIGHQAQLLNYGIFRQYCIDGVCYYDCGPITYYTDEDMRLLGK